ncbi:MAG: PEP-CTERM sorting domain-containing protein [Planctomycetales bacterium]|nr:PEP-CTERM sorting domain-containing protein [Planctomycetales bacterium]
MKKMRSLAIVIVAGAASVAFAANGTPSIAINFGADELGVDGAESAYVEGAAGVLKTVVWNNFETLSSDGDQLELVSDVDGQSVATAATVEWNSANTWSSDGRGNEDSNDAEEETPDRALMLGYLDNNPGTSVNINIEGLGEEFTSNGFDVYVYIQGGVIDAGRGGGYAINGGTLDPFDFVQIDVFDDIEAEHVIEHIAEDPDAIFEGVYEQDVNYILFEDLNYSEFNLQAIALYPDGGTERAPINGIEIVARANAGVAGDFNANGMRDVGDLDLLAGAMGGNDATFDLNGDGSVNYEDRRMWVEDLTNTFIGDANFDGQFNSSDFVAVFGAAKYEKGEAATWSEGDWNGDGVFSSSDFVAAFGGGGYETGPRDGGLQTVPEPSSIVLILFGLCGLARIARRK